MYRYHCGTDGDFNLVVPPGTAPPDLVCPLCGEASEAVDARTGRVAPAFGRPRPPGTAAPGPVEERAAG